MGTTKGTKYHEGHQGLPSWNLVSFVVVFKLSRDSTPLTFPEQRGKLPNLL
jgi:hypothetical protein